MSATRAKNFDFGNDASENILHTPILLLAIWQMKRYKERKTFILQTTFWKCLVPCQNAVKKCTIKTELKIKKKIKK